MKKIILLILLMLSIMPAHAQTEERHTVYCELMGYNFWGVGKVKVQLDMGKYSNSKDDMYK